MIKPKPDNQNGKPRKPAKKTPAKKTPRKRGRPKKSAAEKQQPSPAELSIPTIPSQQELAGLWQDIENPQQRAFLSAFAVSASVTKAAKAAGVSASLQRYWRSKDTKFAAALQTARDVAIDIAESEAYRRAVEGVVRVKFYKGEPLKIIDKNGKEIIYTEHEYDSVLLIFLLKHLRPEVYGEKPANINVGGENVQIIIPDNGRDRLAPGYIGSGGNGADK